MWNDLPHPTRSIDSKIQVKAQDNPVLTISTSERSLWNCINELGNSYQVCYAQVERHSGKDQ